MPMSAPYRNRYSTEAPIIASPMGRPSRLKTTIAITAIENGLVKFTERSCLW